MTSYLNRSKLFKMAAPMRPYFLLPARCRSYYKFIRGFRVASGVCSKNEEDGGLESNPFYSKYATKIEEMRRTNPEEYQSRVEEKMKQTTKKIKDPIADRLQTATEGKPSLSSPSSGKTHRSLSSVLKLDLIQDKTKEEISQIWKDYHRQKDGISAVIPETTYSKIHERSQKFPLFLYPLPRDQGYEFVIGQFDEHNCHFTSLINYQAYQENAPILMTMIHYTELMKEKGIVLMHGELDTKLLQVHEAQFLANQVQLYYGRDNQSKLELLDTFTNKPEEFKYTDVIQELENTKVSLPSEQ
ncbi:ATP synthase mitochondrial F1 complex assembly factor 1-like [Ptychodera flava]|uniref:ATP synthase mitochondrial F1 complex assembly factor 1-like n=1 Tax=Ptychodera flava TaxID=63121 RepID=UPI00396A7A1E